MAGEIVIISGPNASIRSNTAGVPEDYGPVHTTDDADIFCKRYGREECAVTVRTAWATSLLEMLEMIALAKQTAWRIIVNPGEFANLSSSPDRNSETHPCYLWRGALDVAPHVQYYELYTHDERAHRDIGRGAALSFSAIGMFGYMVAIEEAARNKNEDPRDPIAKWCDGGSQDDGQTSSGESVSDEGNDWEACSMGSECPGKASSERHLCDERCCSLEPNLTEQKWKQDRPKTKHENDKRGAREKQPNNPEPPSTAPTAEPIDLDLYYHCTYHRPAFEKFEDSDDSFSNDSSSSSSFGTPAAASNSSVGHATE